MKIFTTNAASKLLTITLLCLGFVLQGQNTVPKLDTSFNHGGSVIFNSFDKFIPQNMIIQPDGKIVFGGYSRNTEGDDYDGLLYRLNPNGTVDPTFGIGGESRLEVDGGQDAVEGLHRFSDGSFMVLLASNYRIILAKLLPDGSPDPNFGTEGYIICDELTNSTIIDMAVQGDNKVVVVGSYPVSSVQDWGFARRYNEDGSLDTGYGFDGEATLIIEPTETFQPQSCLLQPDGKLLVTGYYGAGPTSGAGVVRLDENGMFDNTFNGDGRFSLALGNTTYSSIFNVMALSPSGTIYAGGAAPTGSQNDFCVVALTPDGELDTGFGTLGGYIKIPFSYYAAINAINVQPNGKIMLGGYTYNSTSSTVGAMARLNSNGTLDPTFGVAGKKTVPYNIPYKVQIITAMQRQADGRYVASLWLNETINVTTPGDQAAAYVVRYITEITSKAEEPSAIFLNCSVSPNPATADQEIALEYTLDEPQDVTVALYDFEGREISNLLATQHQAAGKQLQRFNLPDVPAGIYFVALLTNNDYKVLKLVKQ